MDCFTAENYIHVPGFAIVELGLSGNELLCYSLVYGFSQDKETEFTGSLSYVAAALNVTKQNAKKILDRLVDKGLLEKKEVFHAGVKFCHFAAIAGGVAKRATPLLKNAGDVAETITRGVAKRATHIIEDDKNIDNIENNDGGLFPEEVVAVPKKEKKKNLLFQETEYYNNPDRFISELLETGEFADLPGVDWMHYYFAAIDWSLKGNKYTQWIAGVRGWIRADKRRGILPKKTTGVALSPDAIQYLKDMAD